jgi:hypothetical protein
MPVGVVVQEQRGPAEVRRVQCDVADELRYAPMCLDGLPSSLHMAALNDHGFGVIGSGKAKGFVEPTQIGAGAVRGAARPDAPGPYGTRLEFV